MNSLTFNKELQQKNFVHVWSILKSHMIIHINVLTLKNAE